MGEMHIRKGAAICSGPETIKQYIAEQELESEIKKEIMQVLKKHNLRIYQAESILLDCKNEISACLNGLFLNEFF